MKWVNRLYIFFLGIALTITTGFGIAAFHPEPQAPSMRSNYMVKPLPTSCSATPQSQSTAECQKIAADQQAEQDRLNAKQEAEMNTYQTKNASYTRTSIFLGIVIGALYAIVGILIMRRSQLLATGLLLASVLTALLTRFCISLASLGSGVTSTTSADSTAYFEFGILLIVSVGIVIVGLSRLSDEVSHR